MSFPPKIHSTSDWKGSVHGWPPLLLHFIQLLNQTPCNCLRNNSAKTVMLKRSLTLDGKPWGMEDLCPGNILQHLIILIVKIIFNLNSSAFSFQQLILLGLFLDWLKSSSVLLFSPCEGTYRLQWSHFSHSGKIQLVKISCYKKPKWKDSLCTLRSSEFRDIPFSPLENKMELL